MSGGGGGGPQDYSPAPIIGQVVSPAEDLAFSSLVAFVFPILLAVFLAIVFILSPKEKAIKTGKQKLVNNGWIRL